MFIPLDIFRETHHNIDNKTEAWLTFLSTDSPEIIIKLINKYPQFREMYDEIYTMCSNVEKVMEGFAKRNYQQPAEPIGGAAGNNKQPAEPVGGAAGNNQQPAAPASRDKTVS